MGVSQQTNALRQPPLFSLHQKDRCQRNAATRSRQRRSDFHPLGRSWLALRSPLWGRSGSVASNPERQQCESEQPFAVVTRQQRQQARIGPDNNPLSDVGGPTGHLLQFKGKKSPLSRRRCLSYFPLCRPALARATAEKTAKALTTSPAATARDAVRATESGKPVRVAAADGYADDLAALIEALGCRPVGTSRSAHRAHPRRDLSDFIVAIYRG